MRELSSLWHFSRRFSSIDGRKVERGKREVKEGGGGEMERAVLIPGQNNYKRKGKFYLGPKNFCGHYH